ncbi:glutamate--cysteine ligase [Enterovibrio norvegicus]|uniref:glutamate--cysteine ligase n=1 Tax=Enterovibrio norvegicus TaxID=188144 RepID=UPI000C84E4C3|nr:glutamate--cysteine ligase [Enterovibrio norvegicus]PMI34548.1 glutamate--cysteine ligase [Enterovibrio norvegicus]PMN45597.1 glutamate--cysteine ligase [Enterovibrio norvegicus]TKF11233.1 glutamate--cysteine ligase [Enterovibrio norvegicus]TKF31229.1 glutamate--cysteine ligase [Enterovibrio norvegicus]
MGQNIIKTSFSGSDHTRFALQLKSELEQLEALLNTPGWGVGECTLGAELELYLTDKHHRPAHYNVDLLEKAADPLMTAEINRFNLEYNCPYTTFKGAPFSFLKQHMDDRLLSLQSLASETGINVTPIGILPTLQHGDFGLASMTDSPRYHALTDILCESRGGPFHIRIHGAESLEIDADDLTLEGANTSFQVHYRVKPDEFATWYNGIQLATIFTIAMGANSPIFLERKLWHETRVPLFKQSIDSRNLCGMNWHTPARVSFGKGYVRKSALELFRQGVSLQPVLLPDMCDTQAKEGCGPPLEALRLHQSTIWSWNRAVYDDADNGHLRVELRSLPAGPTTIDMVANAALCIGLAHALRDDLDRLMDLLPFEFAKYNFYRAAQFGVDAKILWESENGSLAEFALTDVLAKLLPKVADSLIQLGVSRQEADMLMMVIEHRLAKRQNGASWQLATLTALEKKYSASEALGRMFGLYQKQFLSGEPVSHWSVL